MRVDLDGVAVLGQAQAGQDALAERGPVDFRIGRQVGVVVAGGAVELGQGLDRFDGGDGAIQARRHVGEFLAKRRRAGRLAVGARQHRLGGRGVGQGAQGGGDAVQGRQQHFAAGLFQHQAVAEVVDVFAGAGEMHEFQRRSQLGVVLQLFLDEVLHRLDVVVGGALDLLHARGLGRAENGVAP
ncbi:hypothetical protein G6F68_015371 [Rhizopus microsporus]|nr:hypothetical protein G6F68_015371 [Rhizopus microsporus]